MSHWRLLIDSSMDSALAYALDAAIAERVGQGLALPTIRLWRPGRCLALGRFDSKLPQFTRAVEQLKADGLVVLKRLSGGQAVWQDERFLNFSVIAPRRAKERLGIPETYKRYSQGFVLGLRELGLNAEFRRVEGAFCDGPYDLAVSGKKLVGTAQVQKRGVVVVHGTMPVAGGLEEMVRWVSKFYELAGKPVQLKRESMATLHEVLGQKVPWKSLIDALQEGHRCAFGAVELEELLPEEWARAHELRETLLL
jgi:lipoate-protein ligase A